MSTSRTDTAADTANGPDPAINGYTGQSQSRIIKGSSEGALAEARRIAATINCQAPLPDTQPCGVCTPCRQMSADTWPYWLLVSPMGASDMILMPQIRELLAWLVSKADGGQYKVAVLAEAHRLREDCQNLLLKTLEEPPTHTLILLLTDKPGDLLPTVRSRCQVWTVLDEGHGPDQADIDLAMDVLWALQTDGYRGAFEKAAFVDGSRKKRIHGFLDAMEYVLRNGLVACLAGMDLSGEHFLEALDLVWRAGYLAARNVNTLLVLETLFLKLRKLDIRIPKGGSLY